MLSRIGQSIMSEFPRDPLQNDKRAANRHLALILFSIVVVFFIGVIAKRILLG